MLHFVYANDVQLCLWPTAFDRLMFSLPLIKVTWNNVGQVVLNFSTPQVVRCCAPVAGSPDQKQQNS